MCRLFGFRSTVPSRMHRSLVLETNALKRQSLEHPDGWGIAYYVGGEPRVARGTASAHQDRDFDDLCQFVASETVVAHVRKASVGELAIENTHPFKHGAWVMAHNGTVPDFAAVAPLIEERIAPHYRQRIEGDTDSERLFALFMTRLAERTSPHGAALSLDHVFEAMAATVVEVAGICVARNANPSLNLIVTNGTLMAAFRHGRTLHFSTHKSRCPERDSCPAFAASCEASVEPGSQVNHLVLASEIIGGAAVWQELPEDELIGVDAGMRLARRRLSVPAVALAPTA